MTDQEQEVFELMFNRVFRGQTVDTKKMAECELIWEAALKWERRTQRSNISVSWIDANKAAPNYAGEFVVCINKHEHLRLGQRVLNSDTLRYQWQVDGEVCNTVTRYLKIPSIQEEAIVDYDVKYVEQQSEDSERWRWLCNNANDIGFTFSPNQYTNRTVIGLSSGALEEYIDNAIISMNLHKGD